MIKEEKGAASIVEYAIVLPICLFMLVFIFFIGYYLNQCALLDAAVNRGVLIAQKIYTDPNSEEVMMYGDGMDDTFVGFKKRDSVFESGDLESDPYRFFDQDYKEDTIKTKIENKVKSIIANGQLLMLEGRVNDIKVNVSDISGVISRKISVSASQKMYIPVISILLSDDSYEKYFTIQATASANISNTTEFVRNSDFVYDTFIRFGGGDIVNKIKNIFDKITSFIGKLGE